jgi:hypothetical protein
MPVVTSPKDPTNQGRLRKFARRLVKKRLLESRNTILDLFKAIPRRKKYQKVVTNDSEIVWQYDFDASDAEAFNQSIQNTINEAIQTTEDKPSENWWWSNIADDSYRIGAMSENNNIEQMMEGLVAITFLSGLQLITRPEYQSSLIKETVLSYNTFTDLSIKTSSQVYQVVIAGIESGRSPKEIRADIIKRFSVATSSANVKVDTEINRINNNARIAIASLYRDAFGLDLAVLHISALISTTRFSHAQRHGKVYTPEAQNSWWNSNANRINCHCSIRTVRVDKNGKVISDKFTKRTEKQRDLFDM